MRLDRHVLVQGHDRIARRIDLGTADIGAAVDHLALQIGERDTIIVDDAERADSRRGEVEQRWRAEPAGPDHEDSRRRQRLLARLRRPRA